MPNKTAAAKAWRQTKRHIVRNTKVRVGMEVALRTARKAVTDKAKESAVALKSAVATLDKAAQKGIIKKNKAARLKSRLMKLANKSKS